MIKDKKDGGQKTPMTDYIATRWYRAPEILLGGTSYSYPIDVWGFGCVLAELYLGKPLFPGTSTLNQLSRIMSVTGMPSKEELLLLGSPLEYDMFKNLYVAEYKIDIAILVGDQNASLVDLLEKCLKFNPFSRPNFE